MDNIPADQLEVYTQFGIAAEMAQTLEVDAGNVALACLALFIKTDEITPEQKEWFRYLFNDLDQKTLGALLRSVKNLIKLDDNILEMVDSALIARNYLMHRFFPFHNFALFGVEGRKEMLRELGDIQNKLCAAHWHLIASGDALTGLRGQIHESLEWAESTSGKKVDIQELVHDLRARGKRIRLSSDKGLV